MVLSELQSLSQKEKRRWLQSPDGLTQVQEWLSTGYLLPQIADILGLPRRSIYIICNLNSELAAIIGKQVNRPPAYRLIVGLDCNRRGTIVAEYDTAEDAWQTDFIRRYFRSFGFSENNYYTDYLSTIHSTGIYKLSNIFCIAYCEIDKIGILRIRKPK